MTQLRLSVTLPTLLFIGLVSVASLASPSTFVNALQAIQTWILEHFDWLFDWTVFFMVIATIIVYVSPLGNVVIGGEGAKPILPKSRWCFIVICTTIATGILFWGCAEPLYHMHAPPYADMAMGEAKVFAMSTLFMHWSLSPYAIYTLISLLFALLYYNFQKPYRVASLMERGTVVADTSSVTRSTPFKDIVDIVCLVALICGMSAALGAGILTIGGGLEKISEMHQGAVMWAIIAGLITLAFIVSSISGLHRGITWLSFTNTILFVIFIAVFAWALTDKSVWSLAGSGLSDYAKTFLPRSLGLDGGTSTWRHSWTTFYWSNWLAWAPVSALFLGRLGIGYTVREFIRVNLFYPSLFAILWVTVFGGVAVIRDLNQEGVLYDLLLEDGPQSVIFSLIGETEWGLFGITSLLFIVFISYVTAADSNTTAMSAICTKGISPTSPEAPVYIKLLCGVTIALLAWVMITYAGLDGIRILSVLGLSLIHI